ncbi:hypothetical protein CWI38_0097p0060 [Hamiltosporidium tvaerminnensis]|uniref:WD40 domain-containing protein n=1 Tax=Hamiltosporidium tvaerminnensis TaxID=1176355 RepID=A0A4Q9L815_9MICR|nr:hypothetical protein LUQ84_003292 [Hamiltosporidium tvaerminnensis]TBU03476.1 hypothetical protein CWI37_0289p0030 [Hamiltosporidium tvaerminnensis]TBU20283.1 hypothetical protein CWI38_0097p0060 [Hamiltosporidium tvaerminnensis]
MKYRIIKSLNTHQKVLAVAHHNNEILVGGTSRTLESYNITTNERTTFCEFSKAVRSISVNNECIAGGSYDGTVVIFTPKPFQIEGPDTEIKGISISNHNMLAVATRGKTVWIYKIKDNVEENRKGNDDFSNTKNIKDNDRKYTDNTKNTSTNQHNIKNNPYSYHELYCILNDHTQDVKGVKWLSTSLYSYGYDCTIKRYSINIINNNYELIQDIKDFKNTIWDITFTNHSTMIACTEDGYLYIYTLDMAWELKCKIFASNYPIYSICSSKDYIFYVLNKRSVGILDTQFMCKEILIDLHTSDINSLFYCEVSDMLITGGDDGITNAIEIDE